MLDKSRLGKDNTLPKDGEEIRKVYNYLSEPNMCARCTLCGNDDHVTTTSKKRKVVVNYFACPKFAKMNPMQRLIELKK